MRMLGKLLGMWALGKTVTNSTPLILRLLTAVAAILALATVILLVLAVLLVGGVWAFYTQLIANDYTQIQAVVLIGCVLVTMLLALVLGIQCYAKRVQVALRQLAFAQAPVSGRVSHVLDEFMRGYRS